MTVLGVAGGDGTGRGYGIIVQEVEHDVLRAGPDSNKSPKVGIHLEIIQGLYGIQERRCGSRWYPGWEWEIPPVLGAGKGSGRGVIVRGRGKPSKLERGAINTLRYM